VNTRDRLPWLETTSKDELKAKIEVCRDALDELDDHMRTRVDDLFTLPRGVKIRLLPLQITRTGQRPATQRWERAQRVAENKKILNEVINHPEFAKLQKERETLRKELDDLQKAWYWLVNFNAKRLPSSPNWSDYHPDVQKAVKTVFVGEVGVILARLRGGATITEVADELQKPPLQVWQTLKRSLNRVRNKVGSLIYQQRWLHPITFDPREDWQSWQPKSSNRPSSSTSSSR
jgi:hypothetical protein